MTAPTGDVSEYSVTGFWLRLCRFMRVLLSDVSYLDEDSRLMMLPREEEVYRKGEHNRRFCSLPRINAPA